MTNVGKFTTETVSYSGDPEKHEAPYYLGIKEAFAGHLYPQLVEPSVLYHNDGGNHFRDVTRSMELSASGWSGDASPIDANNDGWMDLYVLNMQGNDAYYENVKGQKFEQKAADRFPDPVWGGMGVKSIDSNNDGHMDLFVTNMHADMWEILAGSAIGQEAQRPKQTLMPETYLRSRAPGRNILGNAAYQNDGRGTFKDVALEVNAETYWPWGLSAGDLNADGFVDLFITSSMNYPYRYHPNRVLLNDCGQRFRDAEFLLGVEPRQGGRTATPWFELDCSGADRTHSLSGGRHGKLAVWGALGSRASAVWDLDDDGDLDIVTNDFNSPPMVLISNLSEKKRPLNFLKVQVRGTHSNRDGLGTRVQVNLGERLLTQVNDGQSGYLSQSSLPLYFGLGDASTVDRVTVRWPDGQEQVIPGPLAANEQLLVVEPEAAVR